MYQLIIVCACCPTLHQWGLSGYRKGIFMSSLTIVCVYGCSECVSQSGSGRPFQLMECGAYIMARVVEWVGKVLVAWGLGSEVVVPLPHNTWYSIIALSLFIFWWQWFSLLLCSWERDPTQSQREKGGGKRTGAPEPWTSQQESAYHW